MPKIKLYKDVEPTFTMYYNVYMYKLYPYVTNDGSIGLFSPEVDDIYHSTYGALSEAYEKFILPVDWKLFFQNNNQIKILDICFGIGYNTKSFLNNYLENIYNGSIDTNNIINNDKIYSDNVNHNIFIKAIDVDKNLALISPFFKTCIKDLKNFDPPFYQNRIEKYRSKNINSNYKLKKEINLLLLYKIVNYIDNDILILLNDNNYSKYFDRSVISFLKCLKNIKLTDSPFSKFITFLHNIYYKYISLSHKNVHKCLKSIDFNFKLNICDARQVLSDDNSLYNFVFLDAFTPSKCPCLWTFDFIKLIFDHLEPGGIVLTYSSAANVRNAFIEAGFVIKKVYSESLKKYTGTVAIKTNLSSNENYLNKNLVHELSEFDLGLLKTKAGIFYRDKNLTSQNEAIITLHEKEVNESDKISTTKFKKRVKIDNKCGI